MSVRGDGATRLDVSELGAQRHYLISAWPFIWMLQTIAMCSQLKIVQENVGIYADRDYQQLPIDGVTPHLKIPIVVTGMMFFFFSVLWTVDSWLC